MKLALRLLPWLVAGAVAIILAQVLKTDLEKGWATWLQALVTIGIGAGAVGIAGVWVDHCTEEVMPHTIETCFLSQRQHSLPDYT